MDHQTIRSASNKAQDHSGCMLNVRLGVVVLALMVSSCATIEPQPYWSTRNDEGVSCLATDIEDGCVSATPEIWRLRIGDGFRLHFVEFDDQGWLYDAARKQIDWVMEDLTQIVSRSGKQVSLVVYVHGWKHNAEPTDSDLRKFRHMLAQLRGVDVVRGKASDRELVGVYVAWRGKSWEKSTGIHSFLLNTTFWSRKAAAVRVAQGQPRELFARIRAFQSDANADANGGCPRGPDGDLRCKVRTTIVGHSFGGWIVHAALAESLIDVLAENRDPELGEAPSTRSRQADIRKARERQTRLADTILLINPAYEGSRYEPVHQLALALKPSSYNRPLFVSITTDGDTATRHAFPTGRAVNALFEKKTSPRQSEAIRNTPGHIARYHTHELIYESAVERCASWRELYLFDEKSKELQLKPEFGTDAERLKSQIAANLAAERDLRRAFFDEHGGFDEPSLREPWVRAFCGGMHLRQLREKGTENNHPNTPVWNIRTSAPIIYNHNDFMTPLFIDFMRQLHGDGELMR